MGCLLRFSFILLRASPNCSNFGPLKKPPWSTHCGIKFMKAICCGPGGSSGSLDVSHNLHIKYSLNGEEQYNKKFNVVFVKSIRNLLACIEFKFIKYYYWYGT